MIKTMSSEEFNNYMDKAIYNYAKEKTKAGNWSEEEAFAKSKEEFNRLLPNKEKTKNHYFFSIYDRNELIGMVWLNKQGNKHGFIYDINIFDTYQGKGYGKQAMNEIELFARRIGIKKLELHVFAHNKVAISLYESLGYNTTNIMMTKALNE